MRARVNAAPVLVVKLARALITLAMLTSGCFAPRFKAPGEALGGPEAIKVCSALGMEQTPVPSLRALVEASVSSSDEAASFRYVILSHGSERFRIDMLPLEGAFTLGMLLVRDGKTVLLDAQEETYSVASNEEDLLQRFLGLEGVTREVILGLVTGVLPTLDCSSIRVYRDQTGTIFIKPASSPVVWEVVPASFSVRGLRILNQDGSRIQIQADRIQGVGAELPKIQLTVFKPLEAQIEMVIKKLSIGASLSESLFVVPIPPGYSER